MFYVLLIVAVLCLVGLVMLFWASRYSPEGHEDKNGFHRDPAATPLPSVEVGCPSPEGRASKSPGAAAPGTLARATRASALLCVVFQVMIR